jgi:superfamily II DNA/RNA helicase
MASFSPFSPIPDFNHIISNASLLQGIYGCGIDSPTMLFAQSVHHLPTASPRGLLVHAPPGSGATTAALCALLQCVNPT